MKSFFLIASLFFISCGATKNVVQKQNTESFVQNKDSITSDTCTQNEQIKEVRLESVEKENLTPKIEFENHIKNNPSKQVSYNLIKNAKVNDKTDLPVQNTKSEIGKLAYSIPDKMKVGKFYTITLRITKENNVQQLIVGESKISINDTTIKSTITLENVRVSSVMSAEVVGEEEAFEIRALSTELQNIEDVGYTEWQWSIKPKKSGAKFLKMVVKVRINTDGEQLYKDIKVYEGKINIELNAGFSIWGFITQYWQWIMTTIIIPLIVWFWKKREDKKKKK